MPATKSNYIVLYRGDSQIYAAATKETALSSPPPEGFTIEDKRILFITQQPDTDELIVRPIPQDEVLSAEIKYPKSKAKKKKDEKDLEND